MAPIREVCSPWSSKPSQKRDPRSVQHAAIYGDKRDDASKSQTSRSAPGVVVDGTLTIKHEVDRRK
jgi:hypothetical protein